MIYKDDINFAIKTYGKVNWFALFPKVELLAHGCESSDNVVGELKQWAKQSKKK